MTRVLYDFINYKLQSNLFFAFQRSKVDRGFCNMREETLHPTLHRCVERITGYIYWGQVKREEKC